MKKFIGIFLTGVLSVSLLAGCGGKGAEKPSGEAGKDGDTPVAEQTDTEQPSGDKVTLKWPCIWSGTDSKADVIREIVDDFNEEYADKYEVIIEENTDYQAYRDGLRTSISAGSAPDIFTFDDDFELYLASGRLVDLTERMDAGWSDNFIEGALEEGTFEDKVFAVPYEMGVTPIMYNKRLLAEAGWDSFPETFDELWELADDLVAAGITPFSQMTGENAWTSMLWYSQIVLAIGGPDVYDNPEDPAFVEAAEVMQKLFEYTTGDAVGAGASVSGGHFLAEETAIFINGPWYIGRLQEDGQNDMYEQVEISPVPLFEGGKGEKGGYVGFVQAYIAAGDTGDPAKTEAQIAFLEYLTEPARVSKLSAHSGALFYIQSDGEADYERLQGQMIEQIEAAPYIQKSFNVISPAAVANEFPQALSSLVLGEFTPQEFVDSLNSKR